MSNSNWTTSIQLETQEKFSKLIQNLHCNMWYATQQYDITIKKLKANSEFSEYILYHKFKNYLFGEVYANDLNKAYVTLVFLKKDKLILKNKYKPVSILPSVSKIYERCIIWSNKRQF